MTTENKVKRVIRWFEKDPKDGYVGDEELKGINLARLQVLFNVPETDLMYECYRVTQKEAGEIQSYVQSPIDLEKYDYFIEAESLSD